MKVLSAAQTKRLDQETMLREPISPFGLMERAGMRLTEAILVDFPDADHFTVFCGKGNNGGDGLVISRLLLNQGKTVYTVLPDNTENSSEEFREHLQLLRQQPNASIALWNQFEYTEDSIAVDALFGTGLNGEVKGEPAQLIQRINAGFEKVVSIDMNSGLSSDAVTMGKGEVVRSDITYCIGAPKKSLLIEETGHVARCIKVVDIGLSEPALSELESDEYWLSEAEIADLMPTRKRFSHKGHCGHVVIMAGSRGKCGAGFLSASAALKCGSGWVTLAAPDFCAQTYQTNIPSAMALFGLGETVLVHPLPKLAPGSLMALGPGLGTHPETAKALLKTLEINHNLPCVLDADALNLLAASGFSAWTENMILTPHPGEFDRLCGKHQSHGERIQTQRQWSRKSGMIIVLKGGVSSISLPDGSLYYIFNGSPALSKAGSGDLLTGMIAAFLGQGLSVKDAALLGTWLHAEAGRTAADKYGIISTCPENVLDQLNVLIKKYE